MSGLIEQWKAEDGETSGQQGNGVRMVFEATSDLTAQKAARASELAKSLGLPDDFVLSAPHKAEQEQRARQVEKQPSLARMAEQDKVSAALVREDVPLDSVFEAAGRLWDRETEAIGEAWDQGQAQRELSRLGNAYLKGDDTALERAEKLQKRANPYAEQDAFGLLKPGTLAAAALHALDIGGKGILLPGADGQGNPVTAEAATELFMQNGQHAGIFSSQAAAKAFLGQPEARRQELFANWKQKPDSWVASVLGPGVGIEQIPRMLLDQLPTQAKRAAWGSALGLAGGAATALALGQAGPQVALPEELVTVPMLAATGFGVGGKAGWLAGAGESAFYAERGAFALELARAKDANGEGLSKDTIVLAANTYAALAAAEEVLGEAFFLTLLKPLGLAKIAEGGILGFFRSAVRRAAFDKSAGVALLDVGARLVANATGEGLEEAAQEATAVLVEFLAKSYENAASGKVFDTDYATPETAARIGESFRGGAVAGFWLGSGPIMAAGAFNARNAYLAGDFAQKHIDLHGKVEATNTKQLSPAHMESALEAAGPAMLERVDLPADAVMELYQSGTDLLTPLGITEEEAAKAAAEGHAFTVPVSKLHAYLDQQQFDAAAQIMRRNPQAMSVAEAARIDERMAADAQKVFELYQDNAQIFDRLAAEKERLRAEASTAIRNVPGLLAQVESLAGGVDAYVDTWLNLVEKYALRMGATGQDPAEIFQRVTLDSLQAARRANMPAEQAIAEDLAGNAAAGTVSPIESAVAGNIPEPTKPGAGADTTAPAVPDYVSDYSVVSTASFPATQREKPLHDGVADLVGLYAKAQEAQPVFRESVEAMAAATGGKALFRPGNGLKTRERAEEKITRDNYGADGPRRVVDVLGATLLYDSREDIRAAMPGIFAELEARGARVIRIKDRFESPTMGYKDVLLNIRMPNGLVTELLVTTEKMAEAKNGLGHKLYEASQIVAEFLSGEGISEKERAVTKDIRRQLDTASQDFYDSTGESSNSNASDSKIEYPLYKASALLELLSSSSMYPRLSSVLETIWKKLPSLASTNGMSSYSMNRRGSMADGDTSGPEQSLVPVAITPPNDEQNINPGESEVKPAGEPARLRGNAVSLIGGKEDEPAHYEVRELADIIPSHDPASQFQRRADYPARAQERPYHSDSGEQDKVRRNAANLDWRYLINTNPDATNGPPVILGNGIVLGGNSRIMSLSLAYGGDSERVRAYRGALKQRAGDYGIDAAAIDGMTAPVLVRVVDTDMDENGMAVASRRYNEVPTQALQSKAEGVSKSRLVSVRSLEMLAEGLGRDDLTLREYLGKPEAKDFVQSLLDDGALEQSKLSRLTDANTGRLNDEGKALVENILRGVIVQDYDTLNAAPASALNKLDRVIPALARLKAKGEGWDLSGVVTTALRLVGKAAAAGRKVDTWLGQADLMDTDPDKKRPAAQAVAITLANATQKETLARFEAMAREAERQQTKGQNALFPLPDSKPAPAFIKAFLQPIAVVDGQSITDFDPRGNALHTALQWAYEHGGKGHTIAAALDRLQKDMTSKKATAERKGQAREMIRLLSRFSGAVNVYPPKLGNYFRLAPGQSLFQTVDTLTPEAALAAVRAQYEGTEQWMKAPNGKPTNLNERQWLQVRTPQFKAWFGDWENDPKNASKVVDENGEPLVMYHGTDVTVGDDFGFDYRFMGKNGTAEGYGFYFTSDRDEATVFQRNGGSMVDAYLNMQKPLKFDEKPFSKATLKNILKRVVKLEIEQTPDETPDYRDGFLSNFADTYSMSFDRVLNEAATMIFEGSDTALDQISEIANVSGDKLLTATAVHDVTGHDGIVSNGFDNKGGRGGTIFIAWFSERVKSVANSGEFDAQNPSILYQPTDEQGIFSEHRGSVKVYPESYLISLFKNADLSTLLHETGHVFFEETERMIASGAADETMRRDYETLRSWLNATPGAALTVDQRERLARGFEVYLMEGKAPSVGLESAFVRFKKWLLKIYQSAAGLQVQLTDEVRGVFDRMLATEREVAASAAWNELLDMTARDFDALGLTGPARTTAAGLMTKGREAAAAALQKARDLNRRDRLDKFTRDARDEVRELPVYKARSDMRKTPLDLEAVKENFGDDTAKALMRNAPGALKQDGGVDPEIFAAEHGFSSASDMIAQILEAKRQGEAIADLVRQKESRHDAAYDAFEALLETREVAIQMGLVGRKLADLLGVEDIPRDAYIRAAERALAAMPLGRAVQTGNFLAAMRRALRQTRMALYAGDRQAALDAHRKAMLNMEFVRLSRGLARRRDRMEDRIKRFTGMTRGDPDARYIVMDMGMRYGLIPYNARLGEGRDARTIQSWLKGAEEDGYTIFADDRILYGPGQPWREMGVADFEALAETVKQIVTVERNRRKLLTAQGQAELDQAADAIATGIFAHRQAKELKTVEKQPAAIKALSGIHAIHTKIEAMCLALDGDRPGAAWEYIYKPISEAEDRQNVRFRAVRDALKGIFAAYSRKELADMGTRKELVPEVGEKLTWENRISLALNMGNETNIGRIRDGHKWTDEQIAAILRPLTKRDWDFVQAVWDYIGSFKDEAFALQEEVTGLRPAAVEAKSFSVQTADGHTLELAGGYYPIKYDADKGFLAFMREQKEMDKELFGGRNYGAAMTKNGHLKERGAGGMGSPLLLELSVITDHVFNVVHDLSFRKAVLDAAKVIKHKTVRDAIESTVGRDLYRELLPWLQDVANERQEPMHTVHRWARWARASTSVMQMGFKMTTILTQPLGITQSIEILGYRYVAEGMKRVYANPLRLPDVLKETFARSVFMQNRIESFDREVRDITKQLKPGVGRFAWVQAVKDKAFVPMGIAQMGVDLPTWWGAYAKGLKDLAGDEERAARYADSVVRMSQGSGATKDLARVQRGGDLLRLTTMFYSYFNTFYNLGARRLSLLRQQRSPADIFAAANAAILLWFVPAVFSELVAGRGADDDDDEWKWAIGQILQYPFQAVVGIRDIASGVFGKYGYQITPAQSAPKALVQWFRSVNKALEAEDAGELVKPTAEAAGYLLGLPMKQPIITVGNLWDYITGEDPDFEVRDLFFVKPKGRQ